MWDFSKGYRIFASNTPQSFLVMAYFKDGWSDLSTNQNLLAYDAVFEVDKVMKKKFLKYKTLHAFVSVKNIEVVSDSIIKSIDISDYKEAVYIPKKFDHFVDSETHEPVLKASSMVMSMGVIKYK